LTPCTLPLQPHLRPYSISGREPPWANPWLLRRCPILSLDALLEWDDRLPSPFFQLLPLRTYSRRWSLKLLCWCPFIPFSRVADVAGTRFGRPGYTGSPSEVSDLSLALTSPRTPSSELGGYPGSDDPRQRESTTARLLANQEVTARCG